MKLEYLRKEESSKRLILIIGGWNTTPLFYGSSSPREGWDLAVAYDFEELSPLELPERYGTVYLYAWSFGVVAAEHVLDPRRITEAFAISGTPEGIGDKGIPETIFRGTRDSLSPQTLAKFRKRMLGGLERAELNELMKLLPAEPDIEQLKRQLDSIASIPKRHNISWRRAYIGSADRIIPAEAQLRSWSEHPARPLIVECDCGHYMDLGRIIAGTTPDCEKTAYCFSQSRATYGSQANAQNHFARKLTEKVSRCGINPRRILEIGNGTGTLSRMIASLWPEAEATFVDLCPTTPYGIFAKEEYITADAEEWLEETSGEWDLIVSSSAVQWFANPRTFYRNAWRLMSEGGVMGCTIFTKGNLRELDAARPSPLHYHSGEELAKMAGEWFEDRDWEEEEYVMRFGSAREALLHLRDTGVKGGRKVSLPALIEALREPRLSYRATIETGRKGGAKSRNL